MDAHRHPAVIDRAAFDGLLAALRERGYAPVGPTVRDGAIVYEAIASADDLPGGWTDDQDGGHYRLRRRDDGALFGYAVGPHAWKRLLFPPETRLWSARLTREGFEIEPEAAEPAPRLALVGARACELAALAIQDRVFLGGPFADPVYASRRRGVFVLAVQCGQAGGTCFCVSMGTGPRAESGFDLALTELVEGSRHAFLVETGTEEGGAVLAAVPSHPATAEDRAAARRRTEEAAQGMGRHLDTDGLRDLLLEQPEHPRWSDVAARCLACANCTMVCPTCFCSAVQDTTDLAAERAERWRRWDSCFTAGFSEIHGGTVRASTRARYRQWMTHKLAGWFDQFGTSGCVGCGRCITWCPVGIDITEEAAAIRATGKGGTP